MRKSWGIYVWITDEVLYHELYEFKRRLGLRWGDVIRMLLDSYKDCSAGRVPLTPPARVARVPPVISHTVVLPSRVEGEFIARAGTPDLGVWFHFKVLEDRWGRTLYVYDVGMKGRPVNPENYVELLELLLQTSLALVYKYCRKLKCRKVVVAGELLALEPLRKLLEKELERMRGELEVGGATTT